MYLTAVIEKINVVIRADQAGLHRSVKSFYQISARKTILSFPFVSTSGKKFD